MCFCRSLIIQKKNKKQNKEIQMINAKCEMRNGKPKKSRKAEHVILFLSTMICAQVLEMETYKLKY